MRPERAVRGDAAGSAQSLVCLPPPDMTQVPRDDTLSPHTPTDLLRGHEDPGRRAGLPGPADTARDTNTPVPVCVRVHTHTRARAVCLERRRCNLRGAAIQPPRWVRGESPIPLQDKHRK